MDLIHFLVYLGVVVVLIYDFTNGMQDASNIIATPIASRALSPTQAVTIVATFEFLGPLLGGTAVANTIGTFVNLEGVREVLSISVVLCGLFAAIFWNIAAASVGITVSTSHALVGGLIGSVVASVGADHVLWGFAQLTRHGEVVGVTKVLIALVLSPILGFWVGFWTHRGIMYVLRWARPEANVFFKKIQFLTCAGLAFAHGANDAQKSMGIITLILLTGGFIETFAVPFWVILSCAIAMTLGILSGGWRIVRTIGFGIYKVRPVHAFNSQLSSSLVVMTASVVGAPVSTTHVVCSSLLGIGASEKPKAVRWTKAKEIVSTWIITIPATFVVATLAFWLLRLLVPGLE